MAAQVVIIGAGPVGLTLAVELRRYGVGVRIIDKAPSRTDKSKAICVWSRSLELFDRPGIGAELVAAGVRVHAADIGTGKEKIARIDLETGGTPYPFALMIPQSETERILAETLAGLGVTVERSAALVSFVPKAGGVDIVIEHADGTNETATADWLVGCDGAHSLVRHTLGMQFVGDTVDQQFILADIVLTGKGLPADELVMYWHAKGIVALFPMPGGRTRLIASDGVFTTDELPELQFGDIQSILDERGPGGIVASDPVWLARFRINERKVEHYRSGRVFLAGDAAHVHSPAGGQGMNTGMQDAFNLAWKLALVCRGEAAERLLDSYSIERSSVAAKVIADAGRLTRIAMVDGTAAQVLRNFVARHVLGFAKVQSALRHELSELAVEYDVSPINGTAVGAGRLPRPGHRLPPPEDSVPIGAGDRPRFAVFAAVAGSGLSELGRRQRELVEPAIRPPLDPRALVLVRPDGYVAMISEAGDWRAVDAYLSALV